MTRIEMPMSPQFVTHDSLRVRFAASQRDSEDCVLLLSPWPESLYAFAPLWPFLTEFSSVVAVDLPGFGQSESRPDLMSPEAMGEFVVGVADALGLEHPHAIGPDIGTAALLFAAVRHPEVFKSIVVGGGSSTFPLIVDGVLKTFIEAPSVENFRDIDTLEVINGVVDGINNYDAPAAIRADYVESYSRGRLFDSIAYVRQYPQDLASLSPLLPTITTPVQIIVGRDDAYGLAADAVLLDTKLSRSRLDILECGHCAWEEEAASYGGIVTDWIQSSHLTV
jgi:pimeloyl-ACP methyl ester carboxylesterase